MGLLQNLNTLLWLFGLFCVISNTAAQSQSKRSSRITSSRTSFGTNVKSSSSSSSSGSASANGVNFDCPEEFGYYPHPTDCTQYYVCVFGGALLESCTGGLMYSHELQTCDWPRNVGCEVVDSNERRPQQQQQQQQLQHSQQQQTNANQHVPSRVRFGSAFTSPQEVRNPQPQQVLKATVPPQYHRQPPQVIQAQVQTIPPPPELKVSPNPIITSRGQPKHLLEAQEEIAKLYADAHETLPPVEEEESDRQQRVYRGQPSTVSQVQKDRDGIIHQASINAIPNNDKFSSYNFGNQYRIETSSPSSSIQSQTATPAAIFIQTARPTPQSHHIHPQHQQQQQRVIVETIPSTQTQNRNLQQQQHQYQQQQQLSPPLPTLAQPQPFSQNRNYYNTSTSYNNNNNNNNNINNNKNNQNHDVVSYIPQQQQQLPLQHSLQNQQQQQPQSLLTQNDNVQQSEQSPYDTYYSVYDDDIDLYRDIEYQQQQQQQQQRQQQQQQQQQHRQQPQQQQQQQQYQQPIRSQPQQSTYRPLEIFTTPAPYKPQPKPQPQERPTYQSNQQPLVYNADYDDDLIAQIEQDNAYDQPTRPPPSSYYHKNPLSYNNNDHYQHQVESYDYHYNSQEYNDDNNEQIIFNIGKLRNHSNNKNINKQNRNNNRNAPQQLQQQPQHQKSQLQLINNKSSTTTLLLPTSTTTTTTTKITSLVQEQQKQQQQQLDFLPLIKANKTEKFLLTLLTDNVDFSNRSKQTHANKKLQQQQQQLPEQLQQQQKSQQKHLRTDSHTQFQTTTTQTTTTSSSNIPLTNPSPHQSTQPQSLNYYTTTTNKPKPSKHIPQTIVIEREISTARVIAQTHTHSRQVLASKHTKPSKDANLQSLEDVETEFDESQNVQVQSAEPPNARNTGTHYKTPPKDRGAYASDNYSTSPRGNSVRSQTEKSVNEFKAKSYDIYGGLKSNEFIEDKKSKTNLKDVKTQIKNFVISDIAPQSFKVPQRETIPRGKLETEEVDDIEVLNGASSSTTLRYPGTYRTSTEAKPFEYSLQTGKNGFTLRAQSLPPLEESSKPLYERRPAIQYFSIPSSTTTTGKTTTPSTTSTTTTTTTTEAPTTRPTTTSTTTSTTEKPEFKPHTEIVYVESYYEDDIQPTTYAPPLRTWRNGRPTIQTIPPTETTTYTSRAPTFYDYSYRIPTESSKLQTVAKEYLPRTTSTSTSTSTTSTTTTTTTTTTPKPTTTTTSTTTTTTTPRTTTTTTTSTTTTPRTTTTTTSTTPATTERPIQTFTARSSVFKDNLQKTTTSSSQRFVSPYKSLENILQKEERSSFSSSRSTVKPKYYIQSTTPHPFLQTTSKPLRSYFIITSPPKNINETLIATMATNVRNFSISDVVIGNSRNIVPIKTSSSSTTSTTSSTTTTTESTTPTTMSTIINTSSLRVHSFGRNEVSDKPRTRGRSRYTAATVTNLLEKDDPTTYAPKHRFKPTQEEITTTAPNAQSQLQSRRKIQRARISAVQNQRSVLPTSNSLKPREKYQSFKQELKKHYENEANEQHPRAEALIAGPVLNNQDNTIESTKPTDSTEKEHIVAITDRPLKYYYSNKYRQQTGEHTLAESLQNAGYITSSTKPGNTKYKSFSVLEQLQLFLAGVDSDENESSSPQFVNDFSEPEIKAAVQEIKNLYAATGQKPSWTTTTTTTLRPTTTAKPPTTAYHSTSSTATQKPTNFNSIHYPTTNTHSTSTPSSTTKTTATNKITNKTSLTQQKQQQPQQNSNTSPTTSTTTTPKYFPKFPSSTYSYLTSSSSSSTTTTTTSTTTTTTTTTPQPPSPPPPLPPNPAYAHSSQTNKHSTAGASSSSSATSGNLPPARVSRVNNALKSSIAAAAAATASPSSSSSLNGNNNAGHNSSSAAAGRSNNKFSLGSTVKCSDTTSNAKCNEIPTSNRNRGSSAYQGDRDAAPVTSNRGTHPPRTRPTLKPSGTIVSKAQEFVDIYKYPPSRPEPLYPQPQPDKTAAKCRKDVCLLPDCYCGGRDIPGDLPVEQVPQIVLITFDDSVNDLNKQLYIDLFEKGRVNPNGCPITATFYVSHEWTDYSQVQNLYSDGHEMASHTVSHSFGEQFSQKKWTREVAGQREILAAYGGVKLSDVRGMRAPFLSVGGNKMYKMLYDSNFTYDSSMPVYENRPPSWPYTLDYKIFHDCMIPPCPTKSYPGVWQVPMVMWQDLNGGRCSMGDACSNPSDAEGVTKMIMKNFERHYTTNRAPFGLFYHAAWFTQPHHKEGFIKFLDTINAMPDVWIVTNWQALQWVRDPTPISRINSFQPFQCDYSDRPKRCNNPKVCNLWHKSGVRYMKTCQPCPDIYPWTGKTGIRSSRIDNDIEDSA